MKEANEDQQIPFPLEILAVKPDNALRRELNDLPYQNYLVHASTRSSDLIPLVNIIKPDFILMEEEQAVFLIENPLLQKISKVVLTDFPNARQAAAFLDAGADQYIEKPLNIPLLDAQLRAVYKRRARKNAEHTVTIGDFTVDFGMGKLQKDGQAITLTENECRIIQLLSLDPDRTYTHREIANYVDENILDEKRIARYLVFQVRKKLDVISGKGNSFISTVKDVGYRINTATTNNGVEYLDGRD